MGEFCDGALGAMVLADTRRLLFVVDFPSVDHSRKAAAVLPCHQPL
jgi:hypothetical protein